MTSLPSDDPSLSRSTDDAVVAGDGIAVPVVEGESTRARSVALDIAAETGSEVLFAALEAPGGGTVGPGTPPDAGRDDSVPEGVTSATVTGRGRTVADALEAAVDGSDVDTIVLGNGRGVALADLLRGETTARIASRTGSNVFVVTDSPGTEAVSSILVPVGGGPYSALALSLAAVLARAYDAWIDVYHVTEPDPSADARRRAEEYVESCADRLGDFESVDTWVQEAPDVSEAIIEQTQYYDLTVLGSPTKNRLKRFLFGSTTDDVATAAENTVVTVRGP